jgi:hypothetical protein
VFLDNSGVWGQPNATLQIIEVAFFNGILPSITERSFVCFWTDRPNSARASSFKRSLDHKQRQTTDGRTPLDELLARRIDLYLTTHNTHNRKTSMLPLGFEPTIPAGGRPQTCALDRAATGTVHQYECTNVNTRWTMFCSLFLLPNEEAIARILLMHFIRTLLCYYKSSTVRFYCENWFSEKNWNSYKLNIHTFKKIPYVLPISEERKGKYQQI